MSVKTKHLASSKEDVEFLESPYKLYLKIFSYFKAFKWYLVAIILLIFIDVSFSVGTAWGQQLYIDIIAEKDINGLYRLGIISSIVVIVGTFFLFLQGMMNKYLAESVRVRLNTLVFQKVNSLKLRDIQNFHSGDLTSISTNDVKQVSNVISGVMLQIVRNVILALVSFIYLMNINVFLSSLVLISGPIIFFSGRFFDKKLRLLSFDIQRSRGMVRSTLQENFQGILSVKSLRLQNFFEERFLMNKNKENSLVISSVKYKIKMSETIGLVNNFLTIFIVFFISQSAIRGEITIGSIVAFMSLFGRVQIPFVNLSRNWGEIQEGVGAGKRILTIIDLDNEQQTSVNKVSEKNIKTDQTDTAIELKGVAFSCKGKKYNKQILHNVNFKAMKGEMVAIVGSSGAGKTTLSRIICQLYEPTEGEIRYFDQYVSHQSNVSNSFISYVAQIPFIFPGTIRENITFGMKNVNEEQVIEAARKANAYEFIKDLENGFDTYMSESGSSISGGQKQRIMIARAFLRDTPIIVMDEPTSSLDNASDQLIQKAIMSMQGKKTIIIVAHKLQTIMNADRIIVMSDGTIIESGTQKDLLSHPDSEYRKMLDKQLTVG
ncbi:ABC transporter ATP-binding protein [Pseudogracilibacillus sp. SO30301A]|uniref:ABC transporter ATP-binding protein n=1 Tax=Pseudogracilibacillus sp. SO30301A TaxID=3098291 RepID=UPI00300E631E